MSDYREVGVSVKDHTPYTTLARQVPGLETLDSNLAESIYQTTQEDFWREADRTSQEVFGVEVVTAGRSGGWAVPFRKGEGYVEAPAGWGTFIVNLADEFINDIWPSRLREAIKEVKAEKLEQDAEELRLSFIGDDEKQVAGDSLDDLLRAAERLAKHYGLNIEGRLMAIREETA